MTPAVPAISLLTHNAQAARGSDTAAKLANHAEGSAVPDARAEYLPSNIHGTTLCGFLVKVQIDCTVQAGPHMLYDEKRPRRSRPALLSESTLLTRHLGRSALTPRSSRFYRISPQRDYTSKPKCSDRAGTPYPRDPRIQTPRPFQGPPGPPRFKQPYRGPIGRAATRKAAFKRPQRVSFRREGKPSVELDFTLTIKPKAALNCRAQQQFVKASSDYDYSG
ncbi:hypothetical protein WJX73_010436 [Symbiochloris irregularis]|uniref:Uncharacterized protein n=1 Tax=Symbiochloris irregularis TaxID=706552 RepID=A0AAW1NKR5_9CHLO